MIKLDKKDKNILACLDFDSRMTLSKLAKKTRSSKQLVKYRLGELEKKGLLLRTYASIDYYKLGFSNFQIYVKLRDVTKLKEHNFLQYLCSIKQVHKVFRMGGMWDVLFTVWVEDVRELAKVLNKINARFGRNVLKKEISILSKICSFGYKYIHDDTAVPSSSMSLFTDVYELSRKDMLILKCLEKDARMPNTEIAKKAGVSPETVRKKIKLFVELGIIENFRIELDSLIMDFQHYKLSIMLKARTNKRIEEFINALSAHPSILYVTKTIERSELEVNIFVKNNKLFHDMINDIRYLYPDIMEDYYWNVVYYVSKDRRA